MQYKQFWPWNKVMIIVDYDGIPSGTVGIIDSRWMGTVYLLRLPDGTFRWLSDRSFAPTDPSRHRLEEGEFGVVISEERQNFAKVGDLLQVIKVIYGIDYYGVFFGNELKWLLGFQLARYM
jgi:hypothetical protein